MRVVLDTNIIVSALLSPRGLRAQLVEAWRVQTFQPVVSEPILAEYERALNYPEVAARHGLSRGEVAEIVEGLRQFALMVAPAERLAVVRDDPDHDKFLECAVAGEANYIVSGDRHLLDLQEYRGIQILPAGVFLAVLAEGK